MQELVDRRDISATAPTGSDNSGLAVTGELERLIAAAWRQSRIISAGCVFGFVLGIAYIVTAVPQYTATTHLLLDNRRVRAVQDSYDVMLGIDGAGSAVESQVEVLKSDRVALTVVDKLQLAKDREFRTVHPSLLSIIMSELWRAIGLEGNSGDEVRQLVDEEAERRQLANAVRGGLAARRVPRTLVLEIEYRSPSPTQAANIANGFADAYLLDQLEAKYEANRRASDWLQNRTAELKQHALTSDLAVQRFRGSNDLTTAGGKLVNEQQLGEVNSQLVIARAETAKAEARYERMKTILDGHQTDAVVSEAIGNSIIEQLRSKFVNAAKRESELSVKLGPSHGSVVNLRNEIREYERLMFEELGRIAELYRSELEIARSREKALQENLKGLLGTAATANETLVALRELEREAESYKSLYQSFLQRYQELVQQQSFPITEARVIRTAQPPSTPSHPRKLRVLAVMIVFGGALGVGLGALREFRERAFRTGEQIRSELGLEFLGMLPFVKSASAKKARPKVQTTEAEQKMRERLPPIMRHVLDEPLSPFAETLRAVKIAADLTLPDRSTKVIGIISVIPGEGKSTISSNFAVLLAHLGYRTLLIDGDLRNPGLTRSIAPRASVGIVEAVLEGKPVKDLMIADPGSLLAIMPTVLRGRVPHTSEFLVSSGMKALLKQSEGDYAFIIIDLPPLGPVVDVRAVAPQLDAFLLVAEWGGTSRTLIRDTIASHPLVRAKCLGVVLNKVAMSRLRFYENYGPEDYYGGRYAKYYHGGA
jgi:succinoglycan biosynthesis transport protein ExoP